MTVQKRLQEDGREQGQGEGCKDMCKRREGEERSKDYDTDCKSKNENKVTHHKGRGKENGGRGTLSK